ncbi:hypothetical protein PBY51_001291 [Eleginops maclovinus]|uniref:Uncharacterized protein n=1 Tax=Eleginops maclovinus TaxID=56733 RepID=A0AAN8A5F2_ELEMC|nr:hypothetical protein PBY51_001291 [Eleginops maclovinus]
MDCWKHGRDVSGDQAGRRDRCSAGFQGREHCHIQSERPISSKSVRLSEEQQQPENQQGGGGVQASHSEPCMNCTVMQL